MTARTSTNRANNTGSLLLTATLTLVLAAAAVGLGELTLRGPSFATLKTLLPAQLAWEFSRVSAVVGYLMLGLSMVWGLVLSTRVSKKLTPPPIVLNLHNAVSWAALGLAGLHALALLLDTYYTYTPLDLLIPFTGPYRPFWVGIGIISLYGVALTTVTFAWRSWLGQKAWRNIHMLTFPVFGAATIHGFMAGTESTSPIMRVVYLASAVVVGLLINYRLVVARRKS
jgi:predicted ferric reductase